MNLQRLKTRSQFQAVLAGKTVARTSHFVLHCSDLPQPELLSNFPSVTLFPRQTVWLGAMVPKRWAKRAVTRNTIKRQIYNVSAEYESSLAERAHVVRLRRAFNSEEYKSATSIMLRCAIRTELHQLFGSQLEVMPSTSSNSPVLHHTP
jgi:ribonuclease P protein component